MHYAARILLQGQLPYRDLMAFHPMTDYRDVLDPANAPAAVKTVFEMEVAP